MPEAVMDFDGKVVVMQSSMKPSYYNNITAEKRSICKNFELPSGIVLGKSTFDDVQRVYGASVVYDFYNSKKTKYYLSDSIADGSMTLFFFSVYVLCGIVMTFDYLIRID